MSKPMRNCISIRATSPEIVVRLDDDISIITSDREMIAQIPGVREIMLNYIPKGWKNGEYKKEEIENEEQIKKLSNLLRMY